MFGGVSTEASTNSIASISGVTDKEGSVRTSSSETFANLDTSNSASPSVGSASPTKMTVDAATQVDIPPISATSSHFMLVLPGKSPLVWPIKDGALDIRKLAQKTGMSTYDPGLRNTAIYESAIASIDGQKGELLFCGYPIRQLAESCDSLEMSYLLQHAELPNQVQKRAYEELIASHAPVPEEIKSISGILSKNKELPMAKLQSLVSALSLYYPDAVDKENPSHRELAAALLVAKMPTLVAMLYKHSIGQEAIPPRSDLSFSENFLHMMFAQPGQEYKIDPVLVRAFDRILVLHADHGQNASTFTTSQVGSTDADSFACVGAAIGSLSGPKHGGANEDVLNMLEEIGSIENIPTFLDRVKRKEVKAPGFGHAVYKAPDPRSVLMSEICREALKTLDVNHPYYKRFELTMALVEAAGKDEYFTSRGLYPNVDLFSGIVFSILGIPPTFFPLIFAAARTQGWLAQLAERMAGPNTLIRPLDINVCPKLRDVLQIGQRL